MPSIICTGQKMFELIVIKCHPLSLHIVKQESKVEDEVGVLCQNVEF